MYNPTVYILMNEARLTPRSASTRRRIQRHDVPTPAEAAAAPGWRR